MSFRESGVKTDPGLSHRNSHIKYLMTNSVLTRDIDGPVSRLLFTIRCPIAGNNSQYLDHVSYCTLASRPKFTADAFHRREWMGGSSRKISISQRSTRSPLLSSSTVLRVKRPGLPIRRISFVISLLFNHRRPLRSRPPLIYAQAYHDCIT